jgi:hypothetical protein
MINLKGGDQIKIISESNTQKFSESVKKLLYEHKKVEVLEDTFRVLETKKGPLYSVMVRVYD